MGEEAATWFQQYLEIEGCKFYYMAPHHKARTLLDAEEMAEFCRPGDEVNRTSEALIHSSCEYWYFN